MLFRLSHSLLYIRTSIYIYSNTHIYIVVSDAAPVVSTGCGEHFLAGSVNSHALCCVRACVCPPHCFVAVVGDALPATADATTPPNPSYSHCVCVCSWVSTLWYESHPQLHSWSHRSCWVSLMFPPPPTYSAALPVSEYRFSIVCCSPCNVRVWGQSDGRALLSLFYPRKPHHCGIAVSGVHPTRTNHVSEH